MSGNPQTPATDIAELARQALEEATRPERIKEIVDAQVRATVDEAFKSAVRSYSPFGRVLEKKIEAALSLNNLDLPDYNQMICHMVQEIVRESVSDMIEGRLREDIRDMLNIAPKTIKLSEIVADMVSDRREMDYDLPIYNPVVTCHVERRDERFTGSFGPSWEIYLDDRHAYDWSQRKEATVHIHLDHGLKENKDLSNDELHTGTISFIRENGAAITGKGNFSRSRLYGLSGRILAYYAAKTVIEVDEDNVITEIGD